MWKNRHFLVEEHMGWVSESSFQTLFTWLTQICVRVIFAKFPLSKCSKNRYLFWKIMVEQHMGYVSEASFWALSTRLTEICVRVILQNSLCPNVKKTFSCRNAYGVCFGIVFLNSIHACNSNLHTVNFAKFSLSKCEENIHFLVEEHMGCVSESSFWALSRRVT